MAHFCTNLDCPARDPVKGTLKRLAPEDKHVLCLRCLGTDHDMASCSFCKAFSSKARRLRSIAQQPARETGVWARFHDPRQEKTPQESKVVPGQSSEDQAKQSAFSQMALAYAAQGLTVKKVQPQPTSKSLEAQLPVALLLNPSQEDEDSLLKEGEYEEEDIEEGKRGTIGMKARMKELLRKRRWKNRLRMSLLLRSFYNSDHSSLPPHPKTLCGWRNLRVALPTCRPGLSPVLL